VNEQTAKKQLRNMLDTFTAGTVLHLLGEVFRDDAEEARQVGDAAAVDQCRNVEATLFVVGMGIDAARPR
jgi:hypothetical protein